MLTRHRALLLLLFTLLASQGMSQAASRPATGGLPCWERQLDWLPEDTETLIVSQGPFDIPSLKTEQFKFDEEIRFFASGGLPKLQDGTPFKELVGQKVLCAIQGSRRFTPPRNLGGTLYEGASILQFDLTADAAVRKAFDAFLVKAGKKIVLAGKQIAVFTEKYEADVWSFFIAQPEPGVLICATNRAYLEETLRRIARKPDKRAFPADLPEWKHVDLNAHVWAIRHYRKEFAKNDPTSPFRSDAVSKFPGPNAVGLVFWYYLENDNRARMRYLLGAKNAVQLANRSLDHPNEIPKPEIKQVAPGIVEIAISVSDEEIASLFLLSIMASLGHALYI